MLTTTIKTHQVSTEGNKHEATRNYERVGYERITVRA